MKISLLVSTLAFAINAESVSAQPALEGQTVVAVAVHGLRQIKESIVLDQIASKPGQPYRRAVADQDVARLDRLGVFGDIAVTPVAVDNGVRVDVTVVETLRVLPAVSVAVTDATGASAGPAVKVLSLAGKPQEISATARFGGETLVEFSETSAPLVRERLWHSAKLSLRDNVNKLDQFSEHSLDFDARIGLRRSESWKSGAIVQVYRVRSDESGVTLSPGNADTFVSVGGVTEYDSRDLWKAPTRGWWNSIDALWRTGTGQYGTLDVDIRRYQPVATRQTVLATSLLTLQSGTEGVDFPTYNDFAVGGENTVRGWDYAAKRGKNQFLNTIEYRYTAIPTRSFRVFGFNFYGGLALAAFGDLGAAWSDPDSFADSFITGGGIGLRLFIPFVNMVRLDLSFGDGGVHRGLGVNEKAVAQRNRVR